MTVLTYEGVVNAAGQIELPKSIHLPANAIVYVVVPNADQIQPVHDRIHNIHSPHLTDRTKLPDFEMEMEVEEEA